MTAYIRELPSKSYPWRWGLRFDYSPELVGSLKANVPARQRRWCPDLKEWQFKAEAEDVMLYLAEKHCGSVEHVEEEAEPTLPLELAHAYRSLHLLPSAPDALVKAAYRILAMAHHPDRGGTTAEMQAINMAYARLERKEVK